MNKKALTMEKLVILILIIVVSTMFLAIMSSIYYQGKEKIDDSVCKQTVFVKGLVTKVDSKTGSFADFSNKVNLNCPVKHLSIDKSYLSTNEIKTHQNIDRKLSEEMRNCWNKFGEGSSSLNVGSYINDESICIVCSQISFDREVIDKVPNLYGFNEYLIDTNMLNTKKTYVNYFTGSNNFNVPDLNDQFDLDNSYIVFKQDTQSSFNTYIGTIAGGLMGLGVTGGGLVAILSITPIPGTRFAAALITGSLLVGESSGAYLGYALGSSIDKSNFDSTNVLGYGKKVPNSNTISSVWLVPQNRFDTLQCSRKI